jgi:NADPH:quinone reductase-like Zn-dependent oxidoreductase
VGPADAQVGGLDGGYAEYTCVPVTQVIPFRSDLDPATLGAVPEMLQTAYGSLTVGLDARPGQTLLIRGGTSSGGLAAAVLAKRAGPTVLATTRDLARADVLDRAGVDYPILDDGTVAARVRAIVPDGVDAALELVGIVEAHALMEHGSAGGKLVVIPRGVEVVRGPVFFWWRTASSPAGQAGDPVAKGSG